MKKNNPNGEIRNNRVPEESSSGPWGLGSWLRGLGSYLRANDNTTDDNTLPEPVNRRRLDITPSSTIVPATPKQETRTAVLRKESPRHNAAGNSSLWSPNRSSAVVPGTPDTSRLESMTLAADRVVHQSSPQILPRFKKCPPYVYLRYCNVY